MEKRHSFEELHDKLAENHAKFAAIIWTIYGVYAILTGKMNTDSLLGFIIFYSLYFSIGFLVAVLASMLTYLPFYILNTLCDKYHWVILSILATIYNLLNWALTIIWIIFVANWCIGIMNGIL